mmetsp:Transcript_32193/g.80614  ORF Transcript_32193/g.80614 Transcript_32193/m.80614 type:complete len:209 (+) Transcript_32193:1531-2157(+)
MQRFQQVGPPLLADIHVKVLRLLVVARHAAAHEPRQHGAKVRLQRLLRLACERLPGLVLLQRSQAVRHDLLAADVGHHYLVRRQVEVLVRVHHLPQPLCRHGQRAPGQLALRLDKAVLVVGVKALPQHDDLRLELLLALLVARQRHIHYLEKIVQGAIHHVRRLGHAVPHLLQVLLEHRLQGRQRCLLGLVADDKHEVRPLALVLQQL